MSTVIEIPDTLATRLRATAEAAGVDFKSYVVAKLEKSLETVEANAKAALAACRTEAVLR